MVLYRDARTGQQLETRVFAFVCLFCLVFKKRGSFNEKTKNEPNRWELDIFLSIFLAKYTHWTHF